MRSVRGNFDAYAARHAAHWARALASCLLVTLALANAGQAHAQDAPPAAGAHEHAHAMWMRSLGNGWRVIGMGQVFPVVALGAPLQEDSPLHRTRVHLTQPVAMVNLESPGSLVVLRVTPNFEGITQPGGEASFGAWGEGFIDARHPHTLVHEAMLSLNLWSVAGPVLSISAGKGFAPYGTDDPMARPALKYPTNHHLSQILERWTLNGAVLVSGWGLEAGIFGGGEPTHPYDFGNIRSFGDSFSMRLSRRFGSGAGPLAPWELSASYARVRGDREVGEQVTDRDEKVTGLYNAAVRHQAAHGPGTVYALIEASLGRSEVPDGNREDYFALLGEAQLGLRRHQPYVRIEYATRPEYARQGPGGTDEFFRYDHHAPAVGTTRWLINTVGYGYMTTGHPVSARIFIELQHHHVWAERGGIDPVALLGSDDVWSASAGLRLYFGGGPMRMGSYGVLDPMTAMHREAATNMPRVSPGDHHGGH